MLAFNYLFIFPFLYLSIYMSAIYTLNFILAMSISSSKPKIFICNNFHKGINILCLIYKFKLSY